MSEENGRKADLTSGDSTPGGRHRLSPVKEGIYGGMVWLMFGCAVYTFLYISIPGTMLPLTIAVLLRAYGRKKYDLTLAPRPLKAWWKATRVYEIFFANVENVKKIRRYRDFGLYFLIIAAGLWLLQFNYPPLTMQDMLVFEGRYEGYRKMPHNKFSCGDIVSIRLNDGNVVQCWVLVGKSGAREESYRQFREGELIVWAEPGEMRLNAGCRQRPMIMQIQHNGRFVEVFNPESSKFLHSSLYVIAKWLFVIGFLCLLRVWWATRNTEKM